MIVEYILDNLLFVGVSLLLLTFAVSTLVWIIVDGIRRRRKWGKLIKKILDE
jgi:hypothetical protein